MTAGKCRKNLTTCVSAQLAKTLAGLRRAQEQRAARTPAVQQVQQARQAERTARYEHILQLQKQGVKSGEMARTLGMSQRTLQRWIALGTIPYSRRKRPRASIIDPYKAYLLKRWHQGCHSGAQLERELRTRGYKGSPHGVYRYLETLKASKLAPSLQPNALLTLSASRASLSLFPEARGFKARRAGDLAPVEAGKPAAGSRLPTGRRRISHMVRERTGAQLDSWLNKVETSQLPALHTDVPSVHKDQEAVLAGLTLPWSTGPVEGHVNRGIRSLNASRVWSS